MQIDDLPPRPFLGSDALRSGVSARTLHGPSVVRLFHGVYVASCVRVTLELTARAVLLVAPESAVVARYTAARLWGGVVPDSSHVHISHPAEHRLWVSGIDARVSAGPEVTTRRGVPLTTPAQTFVDLAADLDLVDLVVLGDSLVRRTVVSSSQLVERARTHRGRGARVARRAAALVRDQVDSPMETRLRLLVVLAGLPEPVVNLTFRSEHGEWRYRLDLAYPQWKVAIEYDGRQHAESTSQWASDVRRREWFDGEGWRFVVVLSGDLYRTPSGTLDRVVAAVRQQGGRVRIRSQEWRRHFPDRAAA